jgi:Protein of unknown function (DUF3108)
VSLRTGAPAAVLCALLAALPAVGVRAEGLRAYQAVYRSSFKGIGAGDLQLTLKPEAGRAQWNYETRVQPSFLARFVVSADSREHSSFEVNGEVIEPLRYLIDDGSGDRSKITDLHFDWARGRVTGLARGKPLDLAIAPGTQDTMTIRAAVMADLLAGREPGTYTMLDGDELKVYEYRRVGGERLRTALGELDTVIYTSSRKGASARERTWRYWYAASLGYVPVRIEQREDGTARLAFVLRSLKWLEPATSGPAP